MAKKTLVDDLLDIIQSACFYLPFWAIFLIALLPAILAFFLIAILVSPIIKLGVENAAAFPVYAALLAYLVSLAAGFSGWKGRQGRKELVTRTRSISDLRALSWREFEMLTGEFYRQSGYDMAETAAGADGGIDLDGRAPDGQRVIIQCKHWRNAKIGVKVVRETLGIMHKIRNTRAIIIGTGSFTREAKAYAEGERIQLIEGDQLVRMIGDLNVEEAENDANLETIRQSTATTETKPNKPSPPEAFMPPTDVKICPNCGEKLVERIAKRGSTPGKTFIGCSSFPKCRYTQPI